MRITLYLHAIYWEKTYPSEILTCLSKHGVAALVFLCNKTPFAHDFVYHRLLVSIDDDLNLYDLSSWFPLGELIITYTKDATNVTLPPEH